MAEAVVGVALHAAEIGVGLAHGVVVVERDEAPFAVAVGISLNSLARIAPHRAVAVRPVVCAEVESRGVVVDEAVDVDEVADSLIVRVIAHVELGVALAEAVEAVELLLLALLEFAVLYHSDVLFVDAVISLDEVVGELLYHLVKSPVFAVYEDCALGHSLRREVGSVGNELLREVVAETSLLADCTERN